MKAFRQSDLLVALFTFIMGVTPTMSSVPHLIRYKISQTYHRIEA